MIVEVKGVGETIDSAVPTRIGFPRRGRVIRGVAFGVVFLSVAAGLSAIPAFASPETDYANATAQAANLTVHGRLP